MISLDFLQAIPNIPAKPAGIKNALFISKIFMAPSDGATNLKRLGVPWPEAAISLQQVNAVEGDVVNHCIIAFACSGVKWRSGVSGTWPCSLITADLIVFWRAMYGLNKY